MTERLRPSEVAARLGTSTRTVQRWIAQGDLPASRIGSRLFVASDAFDAFVAGGRPDAGVLRQRPERRPGGRTGAPARTGGLGSYPPRAIQTLFIANRGEIARRIARTADRLGIRPVAARTEGPGRLDLLDPGAVVRAAVEAGADAVHPGYGFLAEDPGFASAVLDAGLRWVGPPPAAIRAMGDKGGARRLAARLGVPVLPGYDGPGRSDAALRRAAERLGPPILVKPAGGGGGKGMHAVRDLATLPAVLASARREAGAAFGDDRLILERLVDGPRHVEVQVLFDGHGAGVHLGERDCSLQRRHQKILEETPSPVVDDALRERLGRWALQLAAAVGYVSAGTCEFLVADDGSAWFLEMNTRLQVEHPVTEAVTGRDLVADQLAIASGATLAAIGLDQVTADAARRAGGHAVEVRLYAEDPEAGFLPASGPIVALEWPTGDGIRVDGGVDAGTMVDERFDPMLAKLIAHGPDRATAFARLTETLDQALVLGLVTNLRFLRWLVRQPIVLDGQARIDTLDAIWPPDPLAAEPGPDVPAPVWAAAARLLGAATDAAGHSDPWAGGWRMNGSPRIRLAAEGRELTVAVPEGALAEGPAAGRPAAELPRAVVVDGVAHVDAGGRSIAVRLAPPPDVDRAARAALAHRAGGRSIVVAPMPGSIVAVHVRPGDEVTAGAPIATLSAMKMEHVVAAPTAGLVADVDVAAGSQVARDQALATIDAGDVAATAADGPADP